MKMAPHTSDWDASAALRTLAEALSPSKDTASRLLGRNIKTRSDFHGLPFIVRRTDTEFGEVTADEDRTWLAFQPFFEFGGTRDEQQNNAQGTSVSETLRKRMLFIVVVAGLSMTHEYNWQVRMDPILDTSPAFSWRGMQNRLLRHTPLLSTSEAYLGALRASQPRFLIDCAFDTLPMNFAELLEEFLFGVLAADDNDDPTVEMVRVLLRQGSSNAQPRRVFEVGLALRCFDVSTSQINGIVDVLERFKTSQQARRDQGTPSFMQHVEFRVTEIVVERFIANNARMALANHIRESPDLHVKTLHFHVSVENVDTLCAQHVLVDSSQCLRRLESGSQGQSFAVFASVMRNETALREFSWRSQYFNDESPLQFSAWLAFSFFHADALSRITSVRLESTPKESSSADEVPQLCSPQWVETCKRVLRSTASATDLAPIDPICYGKDSTTPAALVEIPMPAGKRVFVDVKLKVMLRKQPRTRGANLFSLDKLAQHDSDHRFQVVRRLQEWYAIVVPGLGTTWIPQSAVENECEFDSLLSSENTACQVNDHVREFVWSGRIPPHQVENLPALESQWSILQANAVAELITIIGQQLTSLSLTHFRLRNADFDTIIQACPKLKTLKVSNNLIDDITPLIRANASSSCRIVSLSVDSCYGDLGRELLVRQCTELIVQHTLLERLELDVSASYASAVLDDFLKAIHTSTKLQHILLRCRSSDENALLSKYLENQPAHPTPRFTCRLPLSSKLALLSTAYHPSKASSAVASLDSSAWSLIFQFAQATHVKILQVIPLAH